MQSHFNLIFRNFQTKLHFHTNFPGRNRNISSCCVSRVLVYFLLRSRNFGKRWCPVPYHFYSRSVRVAERLALPTSDHGVAGSNPAGGEILPEPKQRFIAQSVSSSPFHRLEMTEILLKGRKNPNSSIHQFL